VNEGEQFEGYVEIAGTMISNVGRGKPDAATLRRHALHTDAGGALLLPGAIDTHVHFRDPGLTHKADMESESRAALAGGITSFADMPNTVPITDSLERVEEKKQRAAQVSHINYGFYIAATDSNIETLEKADLSGVAAVKLFMGSSTGNMAVHKEQTLHRVFALPKPIAVHAEDDAVIRRNSERIRTEYSEGEVPVARHPDIRSRKACIAATRHAIALAAQHHTTLRIMHLSTAEELQMIKEARAAGVDVSAEACALHLLFSRKDYNTLGSSIKCNPAVKEESDRRALIDECRPGGIIDTIGTDHAPHLPAEKQGDALHAASGAPSIQFSLPAMLTMSLENDIPLWRIVQLMCHNPATMFNISGRGFIRPGYYADLVLVRQQVYTPDTSRILSKCGWSPLVGRQYKFNVERVWVNGAEAWPEKQGIRPAIMHIFN